MPALFLSFFIMGVQGCQLPTVQADLKRALSGATGSTPPHQSPSRLHALLPSHPHPPSQAQPVLNTACKAP